MSLNRQMRRQQERKQVREWREKGQMEQALTMMKNGLTKEHLDKEWDAGHKAGFQAGAERALKVVYAACVLELLDAGNTRDEALSFIKNVDNRVLVSIDEQEDITEVFERTGVWLELKEDVNRVREVAE